MTLAEFINHIKHNSLQISIIEIDVESGEFYTSYSSTIGELKTSVFYQKMMNKTIAVVYCLNNEFRIRLGE